MLGGHVEALDLHHAHARKWMYRLVDSEFLRPLSTMLHLMRPAARMVALQKQKNEIRRERRGCGSQAVCAFLRVEAMCIRWAGGLAYAHWHLRQSEQWKFAREPLAEVDTRRNRSYVRGLPVPAAKAALGTSAGTR